MDNLLAINPDLGLLQTEFLGFGLPYQATLELMHGLHEQIVRKQIANQLLLLEHEPVITITRSHLFKSIKTSEQAIKDSGIELALADRGGDATFHGPGQLVGYPLISLSTKHYVDIAWYVRSLEAALLTAMHRLGIEDAQLLPGFTGIWVRSVDEASRVKFKKLIAIGVGIKDGVSKHGFALNIDIDHTRYTQHIVPCGLKDRGVITLRELFSLRSLEMPERSVMVDTISQCLAQTFSLVLRWRT
jgi:lipoyl(octanoyl) transferase